jgi:hypothetical protein
MPKESAERTTIEEGSPSYLTSFRAGLLPIDLFEAGPYSVARIVRSFSTSYYSTPKRYSQDPTLRPS